MLSLYGVAEKTALEKKEKEAFVFYGKRYTYGFFLEEIKRVASGLSKFVKKGDVVTVCMPNSVSAAVAVYAVNKLGGILNLVHPFIPPEAIKKSIAATNSKLAIVYDMWFVKHHCEDLGVVTIKSLCGYYMGGIKKLGYGLMVRKGRYFKAPALEKLPLCGETDTAEFTEDMPAVYLPSGGTTGESKIIVHNCEVFNRLCGNASFFLKDPVDTYKAMYSVLPIFHGFGFCMNLHMSVMLGMTNVMCMKFDAREAAKAIAKEKVGILTGVPSMYVKLLKEKQFCSADLSSLKDCFVGGDYVPPSLLRSFNENLRKCGSDGGLYPGYGLTETVTVCTVNTFRQNREGSVGAPVPGMEIAVRKDGRFCSDGEEGEIYIKGPIMMMGYLSGESPFEEIDGEKWLRTGDYGKVEGGFLYFVQRIKNIIIVSGVNVFPSEIEKLVNEVPGVRYSASAGVPDELKGAKVRLFVQAADDVDKEALRQAILKTIRENLIIYALPFRIDFIKMPLNEVGKIDRKKLDAIPL